MNRFNGLCKVCSERRYRQVGAWPLGGRTSPRGVFRGQGWGRSKKGFCPRRAFLPSSCPSQVHCDVGGGQRQELDPR